MKKIILYLVLSIAILLGYTMFQESLYNSSEKQEQTKK